MSKVSKSFKFNSHPAKQPALQMKSFKLIGSVSNPQLLAYDYWAILFLCSMGALVILVTLGTSI